MTSIGNLRYPIGEHNRPHAYTDAELQKWISDIESLEKNISDLVSGWSAEQLNTPYREGGWNVRQVLNHLYDSHIHAYVRMKFALTEENPTIKPYFEARWAELPDATTEQVADAIRLLGLHHERWVRLMKSLTHAQWHRTFFHPDHQRNIPLWEQVHMYSWHSRHHFAHIAELAKRMGWK